MTVGIILVRVDNDFKISDIMNENRLHTVMLEEDVEPDEIVESRKRIGEYLQELLSEGASYQTAYDTAFWVFAYCILKNKTIGNYTQSNGGNGVVINVNHAEGIL